MKELARQPKAFHVSSGASTLLGELAEECQRVLKLLAQLETAGLRRSQVEDMLGELSAAVLHLHEHTRGLDAMIDDDLGEV